MVAARRTRESAPRARILEAAGRLFTARGPDEVTMTEVAHEAGVARATVFNHFGSKRALVEGITEDVIAYYDVILQNALADRTTPTDVLIRALFEFMGRGIEDDRRFYRAVFREIAQIQFGHDEGGPGQRAQRAALDRLLQLMTRGQARGELSRDHTPEALASAFDSLVNGTITHWLYEDDPAEPLHDRMLRAAEIFLGPVALETAEAYTGRAPVLAEPRTRQRARPARKRSTR